MLDHVSITVSDFAKAEKFYDAIFVALGVPKVGSDLDDAWIGYGHRANEYDPGLTYFSVRLGPAPTPAGRRHCCFKASTRQQVDDFWRSGVDNGGTCNGPPGLRHYHRSYYAAFLADPEGNLIEAVCHHAEALGNNVNALRER